MLDIVRGVKFQEIKELRSCVQQQFHSLEHKSAGAHGTHRSHRISTYEPGWRSVHGFLAPDQSVSLDIAVKLGLPSGIHGQYHPDVGFRRLPSESLQLAGACRRYNR